MPPVLADILRSFRAAPIFALYVTAALVVAGIIGLITFDIIDLGMTHFGELSHRTHDVMFGALFTTMVIGVVAQLRRPDRNVTGMVMALVPAASLILAGLLADDLDRVFEFNPFRYGAAIVAVTLLLHPTGRASFGSFSLSNIGRPMIAMVAVAAIPLLTWASDNITLQRTVTDMHTFMGHYGFIAALGYTVIGVGLLASLRASGWRLGAVTAGLLPILLGVTSMLYPDATSSLDTGWAVAAVAWGTTFIAIAARTTQPGSPASQPTEQRDSVGALDPTQSQKTPVEIGP